MRWSVRLGSLFGIPVYLHFTFLLLLGFVGFRQLAQGGLSWAIAGVASVAAIFGCVLLHEFGHALAARRYGIRTRDVTLLPIGGVARLERMPEDPRQELVVALAGPAVNVGIALLLGGVLFITGGAVFGGSFIGQLLAINIALVLFNMLPAFPMDGGRVLRALLATRMNYSQATELAARVGRGMAFLLGIAGLFWNPMLVLIAVFVWFSAGREAAFVRQKEFWRTRSPVSSYEWTYYTVRRDAPSGRHEGGYR
jgi:Zn-dependent protease